MSEKESSNLFGESHVVPQCKVHIMAIDRNFDIQYINYTVPNLTVKEVIGQPITNFIPVEFQEDALEAFRKTITTGLQSFYRTEYPMDENNILYFRVNVLPYKNGDEIIGAVLEASNITEQVELEKLLEEQKKSALFHQSRMASIGNLASGVGHEINNPLAISMASLDVLKNELQKAEFENEKVAKSIKRFDNSFQRIKKIVNGLRTFARTDESTRSVFSLSEAVSTTISLVTDIYKSEGVRLEVELPNEEFFVNGIVGRVQQVVMNLISNSKDAFLTSGDDNLIKVRLERIGENDCHIIVEDNGSGIPDEHKGKVFQNFYTTKDVGKGTGMGLSLSATIVAEHGGVIELESKVGEGTTFKVSLPLTDERPQSGEKIEKIEKLMTTHSILVVDDEPDLRGFFLDCLPEYGFQVEVAESGASALEKVQASKFDLILTDIKMPGMNGFELSEEIKKLNINPQPKVIAYTGGVSSRNYPNLSKELESHFDSHFFKPFNVNEVLKVITKILK